MPRLYPFSFDEMDSEEYLASDEDGWRVVRPDMCRDRDVPCETDEDEDDEL